MDLESRYCLVCNCDLSEVTINLIEVEVAEEEGVFVFGGPITNGKLTNGLCQNGNVQSSPISTPSPRKQETTDSTRHEILCKLLNLSPSASATVLNDLKRLSINSEVLCGQCTLGLNVVAHLYDQISILQHQIDDWQSQFESQIRQRPSGTGSCEAAGSEIGKLRNLIKSDLSSPNAFEGSAKVIEDQYDEARSLQITDLRSGNCDFKFRREPLTQGQDSTPERGRNTFNESGDKIQLGQCSVLLPRLKNGSSIPNGVSNRFHSKSIVTTMSIKANKGTRVPFKCTNCDLEFKTEYKQKTHMLAAHNFQFPYSCSKCSKPFYAEFKLLRHLMRQGGECQMVALPHGASIVTGSGNAKFKCKICQLTTTTKSRLLTHMIVHNKQRPFMCDICGESFFRSYYLGRHQKWKHSSETEHPFKCKVEGCQRIFSCNTSLKLHNLRQHEQEFNYPCPHCEYKGVTLGKLNDHITRKHWELNKSKTHKCQHCDIVFKRSDRLRTHLLKVHTKKEDRPFPCKYCDKVYCEPYRLRRHELSAHTDKRSEICGVCGKAFALRPYLRAHMKSHQREIRKNHKRTKSSMKKNAKAKALEPPAMLIVELPLPPTKPTSKVAEFPSQVLELQIPDHLVSPAAAPMTPNSAANPVLVSLESVLSMQVESPYRVEFDEEFKMNPVLEN